MSILHSDKDVRIIEEIIKGTDAKIYFIGIGGVSMSSLAELLKKRGCRVAGSDSRDSDTLRTLGILGIKVSSVHSSARLLAFSPDLVVYSLSISDSNPEYKTAIKMGIPTVSRAELLAAVMNGYKVSIAVSGSHGKTTVTSLLCDALTQNSYDALVGEKVKETGLVLRGGDGVVAEACEYRGSFLKLSPAYFLFLNIDHDHVDYYPDLESVKRAFISAANRSKTACILNVDDENIRSIICDISVPVVTFSRKYKADYQYELHKMENGRYKVVIYHRGILIAEFNTLIRGEHNAVNCAAAAIVCHVVSVDMKIAINYISNFPGVKRRLELISKRNFCDIYYDYAHHPCEIKATYSALLEIGYKRILAVFSPHTYTRTQAFLSDFGGALAKFTKVIITDIYGARECAIVGVTSSRLADEINLHGGDAHAFLPSDLNELFEKEEYDCVVLMGAGELEKIKRMVEDF